MTNSDLSRIVPYFNYQKVFCKLEQPLVDIFVDVVRRGAFIMQKELEDFEKHLAEYLGVRYAFGVGNATDGMVLAWKAVGLEQGDEVILPSHTMVATPASVHFAGGVPVLVDCGSDHLLDPGCIETAITERTRAIMPVQLNGRTCDMDRIEAIASKYNLLIVEDAAQALGSKFRGRFAGTFGKAGVFSFYPAKLLGCLGDGGAIVTDDEEMADKLYILRDHGRDANGEVIGWGLNSRLDNLQAAILDFQFREYEKTISRRREIAFKYQRKLDGIPQLTLPIAADSGSDNFDVFQNYEVEAEKRDELRVFLKINGIGTMIQWGGKTVHQCIALGFNKSLPVTERLFERCIMLPMNTTLSDQDIDYVCEKIREFYSR